MTESHYLDKVLNGDAKAYRYFVQKYKDLVFAITFRIVKNTQDAQELSQDAFLKAYQQLHTFDNKAKFSTWLYKIAFNLALNKNRQFKQSTLSYDDVESFHFADESEAALRNLKLEQQKEYINIALNSLPEDESLLLTLYYLAENSVGEICQITSLSEANVKVKLHRARKKLYSNLEQALKGEINSLY